MTLPFWILRRDLREKSEVLERLKSAIGCRGLMKFSAE